MRMQILANNSNITMNVASISEPPTSEDEHKVHENWEKAREKNPRLFNGHQLVVDVSEEESTGDIDLRITRVRYAQVLASAAGIIKEKLVPAGVAALIITSDGKVIIGSRDAARSVSDPSNYPLQVPNGGLDGDAEQMQDLNLLATSYSRTKPSDLNTFDTKQQKQASLDYKAKFGEDESRLDFKDFFLKEGLREVREEVYDFEDGEITEVEVVAIASTLIYYQMVGALVVYKINRTFEQLKALRAVERPKDFWEMTVIDGLSLEDVIQGMNNGCRFYFDGQIRQHLQPYVFHGLLYKIHERNYQNMKSSSQLALESEGSNGEDISPLQRSERSA